MFITFEQIWFVKQQIKVSFPSRSFSILNQYQFMYFSRKEKCLFINNFISLYMQEKILILIVNARMIYIHLVKVLIKLCIVLELLATLGKQLGFFVDYLIIIISLMVIRKYSNVFECGMQLKALVATETKCFLLDIYQIFQDCLDMQYLFLLFYIEEIKIIVTIKKEIFA